MTRSVVGLYRSVAMPTLLVFVAIVGQALPVRAHGRRDSGLGGYEQEAVDEVLKRRKLTVDAEPDGKRIGEIHIVNLSVFGSNTGWLKVFNRLHRETLVSTMRRELLVHRGERWDKTRILESERILRNPQMSSFVVIMPVRSTEMGTVDLLIVTRDVWSLRPNSEFVYEGGQFTFLQVSAAESNLLGRRKHVSLIFEMDQGQYSLSGQWRDLNVLGKRWQFATKPGLILGRATNKLEGSESVTSVVYPLWSLASKWGVALNASHRDSISRTYLGQDLATYDAPETVEIEQVPQEFRQRDLAMRSEVQRSFGSAYKHNLSFGHEFLLSRPRHLRRLQASDQLAQSFARDLFPRSERSSALTANYDFFEARFVTYRDIDGFDLPEVEVVGPSLTVDLALALRALGSEKGFLRQRIRAGYRLDFRAEAFADIGISLGRRIERNNGALASKDVEYGATWFAATPVLPGSIRLVTSGAASFNTNVEENRIILLGGQGDLRGYPVGSFSGTSFVRGSLEVRSLPYELSFLRVGYLAFWDAGHAANRPSDLTLRHNVGIGLKALIPQLGEGLSFLYWAVPLETQIGKFPGRISLGFEHALE
tara:strand:+ start:33521 stop:35302 length:1782 start_codon:yes stop_codon:yes gene_type:complete